MKASEVDGLETRGGLGDQDAEQNVVENGRPARKERPRQRVVVDHLARDEIGELEIGVRPDRDEMHDQTKLAEQDGLAEHETEYVGRDVTLVEFLQHSLVVY